MKRWEYTRPNGTVLVVYAPNRAQAFGVLAKAGYVEGKLTRRGQWKAPVVEDV